MPQLIRLQLLQAMAVSEQMVMAGGPATGAQFSLPWATTVDATGNLYIISVGDYRIRKVTASTGVISSIAGSAVDPPGQPLLFS
ncbi:MAG: hypothetical protein ACKOE5_00775 [Cytophagales bacterium]